MMNSEYLLTEVEFEVLRDVTLCLLKIITVKVGGNFGQNDRIK
jgi:hypothetical protein